MAGVNVGRRSSRFKAIAWSRSAAAVVSYDVMLSTAGVQGARLVAARRGGSALASGDGDEPTSIGARAPAAGQSEPRPAGASERS